MSGPRAPRTWWWMSPATSADSVRSLSGAVSGYFGGKSWNSCFLSVWVPDGKEALQMGADEASISRTGDVCSRQGENHDVPADHRPTLRKLLDQGVTAYKEILELLAPFICPDEAAT